MKKSVFTPTFIDETHKERFLAAVERKVYQGKIDPEYGAAFYLLTADELTWQQAQPYRRREGIDIEAMLDKEHLSSGYRVLIQLAGNLFNQRIHVDPVEMMRLDERNFQLAIDAIHLRRHGLPLSELQRPEEETR